MAIKDRTNWHEVALVFQLAQEEYDRKAVEFLVEKGEEWLKYARNQGRYTDHTANLRNSIGYIVVQYGHVLFSAFPAGIPSKDKEGDPEMAKTKGREFADRIIADLSNSKTYLILVAGMEYAVYVESKDGFWVLEGVKDSIIANRNSIILEFTRFLKSKKK